MSWQNVAVLALLLAATLVAPKLGVDPQMMGLITTLAGSFFVNKKQSVPDDAHAIDGDLE